MKGTINMDNENKEMILFENKQIRKQFYKDEWNYSLIDIVSVLTEQESYEKARKYWNKIKQRLKEEKSESVTNCHQLKLLAKDGKKYKTDCANRETIFRIIQSIPSPNAEPFKLWFARLAEERIQEIIDPSLAVERAKKTYLKKGYSEEWANTRLKSISSRTNLTDEWKKRGVTGTSDYAILTDEISKGTFGITTSTHKDIKGLDKQNLRDNMSAMELALMTLAEVTTTEIHKSNDSQGFKKLKKDAKDGGEIASITRENIEAKIGKSVVTKENALDFTNKKNLKSPNNLKKSN